MKMIVIMKYKLKVNFKISKIKKIITNKKYKIISQNYNRNMLNLKLLINNHLPKLMNYKYKRSSYQIKKIKQNKIMQSN